MEKPGKIGFIAAVLFVAVVSGALTMESSLLGNDAPEAAPENNSQGTGCGDATWDVTSASASTASVSAELYSGQMRVTWFYVDRAPVQKTVEMGSQTTEASNNVEDGRLSSVTALPIDCPEATPASYAP